MMRYFAYGMNMAESTMDYLEATRVGAGTLKGWRLQFNHYANIVRDPESEVPGGVWEIEGATLAHLDRREGYPRFYDRTEVDVTMADGSTERAVVYFMQPEAAAVLFAPTPSYLELVQIGRTEFGLDTADLEPALAAAWASERERYGI